MAYIQYNSPFKKQKGGGTTKTCLPAAKIRSLSAEKKKELVSSKKSAGASGKYKRSSKTNVKGARKKELHLETGLKKKTGEELMTLVKNVVNNV